VHFEDFLLADVIGEGAFSRVFKASFQGAIVAVKRLKVPLSSQDKNYFTAEVFLPELLFLLSNSASFRILIYLFNVISVCPSKYLPSLLIFFLQVSLLRELRHPRVVLLLGVCMNGPLPLMVLEFMARGSLFHHLHDPHKYESITHPFLHLEI
jgi:serine/threonine protein kinase